jgi:uncharacterized protein YjiS (DUF1127 family)
MSMIFPGAPRRASSGGWGAPVRWMGIWVDALTEHWVRQAAIKALRQRDDRELRDIGITRWQIEAAVGGALNPTMGRFDQSLRSRSGKPPVDRES